MEKYNFYVNEPLGVVVAQLDKEDFEREVLKMALGKMMRKYNNTMLNGFEWLSSIEDYFVAVFRKWFKQFNLSKSIVTKARCNYEDGDQFDEKIGKYIAADRMDMRITKMAVNFLDVFTDEISNLCFDMGMHKANLIEFYSKTDNHIENFSSVKN